MTEEKLTSAPTPTTAAAVVHDGDTTRIYATLHAPVMKEFCLEATREDEGGNWYIEVTDEGGYHTYDGYWRDSSSKTADEVLREAVSGSLLDEVSAPPVDAQPICTANAAREQFKEFQPDGTVTAVGPEDRGIAIIDTYPQEAVVLLGKYKKLCVAIGRGDSYHLARIDSAISALESREQAHPPSPL
jgi:hypothetical protein